MNITSAAATADRPHDAARSVVLAVDLQGRLVAKLQRPAATVAAAELLLKAATLLGVPVRGTEQYPKGLGPTVEPLAQFFTAHPCAKTSFNALAVTELAYELRRLGRDELVLVGAETHICVLQTALAALPEFARVTVCVDAVSSRGELDHAAGLARLGRAGAGLATVEMVAYEWLGDAKHPAFTAVSRAVIARASLQ